MLFCSYQSISYGECSNVPNHNFGPAPPGFGNQQFPIDQQGFGNQPNNGNQQFFQGQENPLPHPQLARSPLSMTISHTIGSFNTNPFTETVFSGGFAPFNFGYSFQTFVPSYFPGQPIYYPYFATAFGYYDPNQVQQVHLNLTGQEYVVHPKTLQEARSAGQKRDKVTL
jgi:hypothetical protein